MRLVRRWLIVAALILAPLTALIIFRTYPRTDLQWFSPGWHLVIVTGIAGCALLAAAAALATAARSGQPNIIWLASAVSPSGSACSAMG